MSSFMPASASVRLPTPNLLVFAMASDADECDGYYGKVTYPPESGGTFSDESGVGFPYTYVSNELDTGTFYKSNGFWRWDTSAIPDSATVVEAFVRLWLRVKQSTDVQTFTMDWYDFGGEPSVVGDFAATGNNAHEGTLLSAMPNNTELYLQLQNLSNINKTGFTGLRSHMVGGQPTGLNAVNFAGFNYGNFSQPPRLHVKYV